MVHESFVDAAADEYLLYGEVTGYASVEIGTCDDESQRDQCHESWGLQLKVVEPLQLPDPSARNVELFSFGVDSMCSRQPVTAAQIRAIPIGSRFKIAAKPIQHVDHDHRVPVLDGSDWLPTQVVRLPPATDLRAQARTRFDYRCGGWPGGGENEYFEMKKDILRLERSRSQRESAEILQRLVPCARFDLHLSSQPDANFFDALLARYLQDAHAIDGVRDYRAAYDSAFEDDDWDSPGATWLALRGDPYVEVLRALDLIEDDLVLEGLDRLQRPARAGYLPAKVHLARSAAKLAETLTALDPERAAAYAKQSKGAFEDALVQARQGTKAGDAMAMFMLASMYRKQEAGLPLDPARADRLDCFAMQALAPDAVPEPADDRKISEQLACSVVLRDSGGALPAE
ncbi:MAG TPA: hypothetical protein VH814_07080 [Steroidobacteraceae bacterium]|jgi:hypothetical protein